MVKRISYVSVVGLSLLLLPACGKKDGDGGKTTGTTGAPAAAAKAEVKVGAEIVAATSKHSFREGKVTKIEGTKLVFEYGTANKKTGKKSTWTVDKAKVWLKGQVKAVKAGDHLVCRVHTSSWYPCKIKSVEGTVIKIEDSYGKSHNVEKAALVQPDAATQANIKDYIIKEGKRRAFDKAFEAAGKPLQPEDWKPKKGDKIVIHFVGTSWYGGTVVKNKKKKGKVRIDWEGDTWDDRDVSPDEVAPQPKKKQDVKEGQFVIVRPKSASSRWEHCKVTKVKGDTVTVVNRDESKRKVSKKDIVPIVP